MAYSPRSTTDNKCLYFNTISDLAYIDNGHGIGLLDYLNHFIMVFDLTSTQQASHNFIHPELTNCSIYIELKFSAALPNNIEIFIIGEKESKFLLILSDERDDTVKKSYSSKLMDKDDNNGLIQRKLKQKFRGVFAAANFPSKLTSSSFLIVNAPKSQNPGTHWLFIC